MSEERDNIFDMWSRLADQNEVELCYYCGAIANSVDHVIPRKVLKMLADLNDVNTQRLMKNDKRILKVRSCRECNSLLGCTYQNTLEDRKRLLKERLRKKYKKILATPDWSDQDLEELGHTLRSHILEAMHRKEIIKRRLKW